MGLQMWKNSKITTKKAARILSASKYNAHTEPLFTNLRLLKIEHILKLHELKLYYKFIHIRLPVYLHNLKLDQNSSINNINTRGQHNIHTTRVQHEFAKHSLRYTLSRTINNSPNIILNKIYTHSLHGFATYINIFFIQIYNIVPRTTINSSRIVHSILTSRIAFAMHHGLCVYSM